MTAPDRPTAAPDTAAPDAVQPAATGRARRAVAGLFFLVGFIFATWFARIPQFRDQLALRPALLTLTLISITIGALVAMQFAGALIARFGSRGVARVTSVLLPVALLGVAFVTGLWQAVLVLLVFGLLDGVLDVVVNAQGIEVERAMGRPVLNGLHGAWGAGAISGAAAATGAVALHCSLGLHLALVALVSVTVAWVCGRHLLTTAPNPHHPQDKRPDGSASGVLRWLSSWRGPVLLLGTLGAAGMICEGAISNWSGIYLHERKAAPAAVAALGYTVFTCGETLTRFAGDRAQERFGPVRLIGAGATLFAAGLLIILLSPSPWISIAGLAVAGVGIAPVNPIAFSAAGHCGGTDSGVAIGHYTTLSYGGVLGGPALVGALADGFGLGTALACLLVPAAVILLGAKATAPAAGTR